MFTLDASPSYWWPVEVLVAAPGDQAGRVDKHDFEVEFNRLGVEEVEALNKRILAEKLADSAIVQLIARNWRKVVDAKGASLPWSELPVVLNVPGVAGAICEAFWKSRRPAEEKK